MSVLDLHPGDLVTALSGLAIDAATGQTLTRDLVLDVTSIDHDGDGRTSTITGYKITKAGTRTRRNARRTVHATPAAVTGPIQVGDRVRHDDLIREVCALYTRTDGRRVAELFTEYNIFEAPVAALTLHTRPASPPPGRACGRPHGTGPCRPCQVAADPLTIACQHTGCRLPATIVARWTAPDGGHSMKLCADHNADSSTIGVDREPIPAGAYSINGRNAVAGCSTCGHTIHHTTDGWRSPGDTDGHCPGPDLRMSVDTGVTHTPALTVGAEALARHRAACGYPARHTLATCTGLR